ncbi:MAG TPA: DUF4175 family protein, partial [Gemmataceae bacterium]|nr:DUF4175 family protein [Gemmataceae bacterium]
MATAQHTPVKSSAVPQYESFVEQQLAHARRRLLGFDAAAWALLLGAVVLAYGLSMSLTDLFLDLPTSVRVVCWGVFMAALIVGAVVAARWLLSSVNPHFLARQLEQTVPDAKNSIINWLDLRAEPLAPVIRGSLGRRAAKDLSHADTERAISGKSLWWLGGIAGVLLLLQIGWLIASPGQAWSLLQRAFFPLDFSKRIALRTTLTLLKPEGGNVAVPPNQPVVFRVQADGFVPPLNHKDALKLHFGYHKNEPFEERPLLCDADGVWTTTVHADQVRGGFWYKITGGDAQLPEVGEYRVDVHAAPQVLRFEAAFKFRDYLKTKDKKVVFDKNVRPSIKEMRGTEVTLTVRTNRTLQQCVMELKQGGVKLDLAGEPVPGDPEAWRFKWLLDQSGEFRIHFKSKEGEENVDRQASKIEVIPDLAPEVVMTKPAQDLSLPANGTLVVDGYATDDFGVKSMQLRLKLLKAVGPMPELKAKPYRQGMSFQLVNGKYPLKLDYSDFLALDKVQTATGDPFPLAAGMELEYWIEAHDNCDYPSKDGNLGQSMRYKLTITPSETDKKKAEQDRQAAENGVGQKQGQQDEALKNQNTQAEAENKANGGAGSQGGASQEQDDLKKQADAVQKAMDGAGNKGEAKPGEQPNGEAKEKGPQDGSGGDAKGGEPQQKEGAGDSKEPGDQNKDNQAGASKGNKGGSGDQPKSAAGDGKGPGDAAAGQPPPGEKKDGKGDAAKSSPKGGPNNDGAAKGKGSPDADPKMDLGQQKGGGDPDPKNLASAPPGQTKGTELADNASPKKGPGTLEQAAKAKGGDPTDQPPPPGATPGPPDPSQASSGKAGDRKDSKLEDVAKLRDHLEDA